MLELQTWEMSSKAHKWMHSSQRWGVKRVWPAYYPAGFRSSWVISRLPAPTLSPNAPHSSCFFCLLLPRPLHLFILLWGSGNGQGPAMMWFSLRPCVGWNGICFCLSTCSCTSSMPLELHELDSASVGVIFSINSAEIGGDLSQVKDWVCFQVAMWGNQELENAKIKGTCCFVRANRNLFKCKLWLDRFNRFLRGLTVFFF